MKNRGGNTMKADFARLIHAARISSGENPWLLWTLCHQNRKKG